MSVVSIGPPNVFTGGLVDADGKFVRTEMNTVTSDDEAGGSHRVVKLPSDAVEHIRAMEMREEYGSFDAALFAAVNAGATRDVVLLLQKGADPNTSSRTHIHSALFRAAQGGHTEIVASLLAAGARVEGDAGGGAPVYSTPLYVSAQNGHVAIIRLLLAAGAQMNYEGCNYLPLSGAAAASQLESVRVLLESGADVNAEDEQDSALGGMLRVWNIGENRNNPQPNPAIVEELIRHGADVNRIDPESNETPLMSAARVGNVKIVRMLLDAGANQRHENAYQETAETYAFRARSHVYPTAIRERFNEIIRLLRG